MAELITGKLLFDQAKHKWQVEFFNEKKQQQSKMFCAEAEISADIPKNEAEQFEVQFERKPPHGEPVQIRLTGKDFVAPAVRNQTPPAPVARKQGNAPPQREARDGQRERREPKQERMNNEMPREFHNPYNFVPAVPREHVDGAVNDLGDKPPAGHDRFHAELLSGKLRVQMTVKTPLLLPDTARVSVSAQEHKTFPVRVGADDKPEINPTAIKGMLRSAYEVVTNSRFSVFQSHDERLAFRMDAKEGLQSVPAVVRLINGGAEITLLTGTVEASKIDSDGKPSPSEPMYAAWLLSYVNSGIYRGTYGKHGQKVWAYIVPSTHRRKGFSFWNVEKLEDGSLSEPQSPPAFLQHSVIDPESQWVQGYVCITNKNIENKHDERVFFNKNHSPIPPIVVIGDEWKRLKNEWKRLIEDYAETDHSGKPAGVELSRHIINAERECVLEKETFCYARVKKNGTSWQLKELIPVMISRRLHEVSPERLLPRCLKTVSLIEDVKVKGTTTHFSEMSPADRVFGCVRQKRKKDNGEDEKFKGSIAAYRGQLRLGMVECVSDKADAIQHFSEAVPLQILGQPKPQQGRFYVAESQKNGEAQTGKRNNEHAGYKENLGRGLRGRKVYPHHKLPKEIEKEYWDKPLVQRAHPLLNKYFQEFRRPDGDDQRDKQNRSVKGWVKPETVFKFDIHFINLSPVELGALIWLLALPQEHFHRFGGGKPLGFGSVELALGGCEILNGDESKKRYFALDEGDLVDKPQPTETKACLKAFEDAISTYPDGNGQRILQSFLASAKGFEEPIHYPRARRFKERWQNNQKTIEWINQPNLPLPPHEEGLAYEWFVENNKPENRLVLSDLIEDQGLPIFDHKVTKGG